MSKIKDNIGWSVSNAASGDNLKHGFETEEKAYEWLEANIPENERDLCIVEEEDNGEFWPPGVLARLEEMKGELVVLRSIFDYNGGRGIELADEIDELQARIDELLAEKKDAD